MTWKTVKFVSDLKAPHSESRPALQADWPELRGTYVRIRRVFHRGELIKMNGFPDCPCELFFEIDPEEFEPIGSIKIALACRRTLEMD